MQVITFNLTCIQNHNSYQTPDQGIYFSIIDFHNFLTYLVPPYSLLCSSFELSNSSNGIGNISLLPATKPRSPKAAAASPQRTRSNQRCPSPANSTRRSLLMLSSVAATGAKSTLSRTAFKRAAARPVFPPPLTIASASNK